MSEQPEKLNIYQKINAVMKEVDYIQKDVKKVAGQYRYVSHDKVTARLHEPLTRHGIAVLPHVKSTKQDGNRTEVILEVKFVNIDNPKDFVCVDYFGYGIDTSDKGPGKAISYAYKYALLKTFCLETGDDPEQDDIDHEPKKAMSEEEVKVKFADLLTKFNGDSDLMKDFVMKWTKAHQKGYADFLNHFADLDKLKTEFNTWKEKQQ